MIRVLFVCHGNICRSPMAEFVFKDMVRKKGLERFFTIRSAATSSEEIGNPVHQGTKNILNRKGIPLEARRAVQFKRGDYETYDYIIGMDERNVNHLLHTCQGDPFGKISKLLAFAGKSGDIADPWYTHNFDASYRDIVTGCEALFKYICKNRLGDLRLTWEDEEEREKEKYSTRRFLPLKVETARDYNLLARTTDMAMAMTLRYVREGDLVIDATAGNGYDTLSLAKTVGKKGRVLAFDVQEEALERTKQFLKENHALSQCRLILDSHENLDKHLQELYHVSPRYEGELSAVTFNFGYMPRGKKDITTNADSSLAAIKKAVYSIRQGGVVTAVIYSGHPEGKKERKAILKWAETLPSKEYHVVFTNMLNQRINPPEILWITRKI